MPTYEYLCPSGHEFERFQKISDSPRARCPKCGRLAVRRISGGAGLIFRGSGFYITDYGRDGKGPAKPAEAEAKPEPKVKPEPTTAGSKEAGPTEPAESHATREKGEKKSGRKHPS